ncbi:SMI1/KNR4 family protein [Sphingobacterium sp. Ag1]|uniref:SMI1/KNR4 family protein n=1 Tax=Sphingobacterium sp. Ag1 TaxID=1643451 RepID=UPI000699FEC7|nr:SMI1/KNR4 family protein [Sphingobacterium sp. Ag1]
MKTIPLPVERFITKQHVCGNMYLPFHYPKIDELESWQSGFRFHGITEENLTGVAVGQWQPGWYVVALNGLDDPFFVDFTEGNEGFPVYYAPHGAGKWEAVKIADSLVAFSDLLDKIAEFQNDIELLVDWLTKEIEPDNLFWEEVIEVLSQENENEPVSEQIVPAAWTPGKLLLTSVGSNKIRVLSYLRGLMELSLPEALELSHSLPVVIDEDYELRLRPIMNDLKGLGAEVIFVSE